MSRPTSTYGSVPSPNDTQVNRGYGTSATSDFAHGNPNASSPLSTSMNTHQGPAVFHEDFDASQRGSSIIGSASGGDAGLGRAASTASTAVPAAAAPSRNNTLKKRGSVKRASSLKRSSSKRSLKAGSIAGVGGADSDQKYNSAFSTPIPTQGAPTEILANRFQSWRQLLKSLIAYFREIQTSYEVRAKAVHKVQAAVANISHPAIFKSHDGLSEATRVLDEYHKHSVAEANKSRDIENDVIGALTGLRSDLSQKIKEIKSLSGDFKNSVEKEKDATRREVEKLQEALQHADHEDGSATGKNDPFVVKLGVDRMIERQIDEENYLHRAYLNLESSGRELESIVVGEIQKAYNAFAGILKREGDDAYHTVELLRTGPIAMPKDSEWKQFVEHDPNFVDPNVPLRRVQDIQYPGKSHPAAQEVRSGMLERKSKYLKSYTPGWYILSATHLHEFKSAEKIYTQPPVMSMYLGDQKLGSRSQQDSSSHKFMLKGKQSGGAHRGHNWVFRAETYDTMMAWFEDIRNLTETTGEQRNAYVRKHARSVSGTSDRQTVSSDGIEDDEADAQPYTADAASLAEGSPVEQRPERPQPGGRFPSDLQIPRNANRNTTPSSEGSDEAGGIAAAGAVPGSAQDEYLRNGLDPYRLDGVSAGTRPGTAYMDEGERSLGAQQGKFALEPQQQDPYLQPQQTAFAMRPQQQDPYAQSEERASRMQPQQQDPYFQPQQDLYVQSQQQPFAQQAQQAQQQGPYFQPQQSVPMYPNAQQQAYMPPQAQQAYLSPQGQQAAQAYPTPAETPQPQAQGNYAAPPAMQQEPSFLAVEPTPAPSGLARHHSTYGDWMAPAAAGVVGAGAGAAGWAAYENREQDNVVPPPQEEAPISNDDVPTYQPPREETPVPRNLPQTTYQPPQENVPITSDLPQTYQPSGYEPISTARAPVGAGSVPVNTTPTAFSTSETADPATTISMPPPEDTSTLGGLEREGAHETGAIFPKILRHDTDMSVSALHVPGEYPKAA